MDQLTHTVCQAAHCGRHKPHFDFGGNTSLTVPYRHLPQTLRGMTAVLAENDISEKSYYYLVRKLCREVCEQEGLQEVTHWSDFSFVEIPVKTALDTAIRYAICKYKLREAQQKMDSPVLSNVLGISSLIVGIVGVIISLQIKKRIDNKDKLIKTLIRRTKQSMLNWEELSQLEEKDAIINKLEEKNIPCDYGVNTIREKQSYYLGNEKGYILLLEIYHGDPDVMSPEYDTLALMIYKKDNDVCSLSDFEKIEQKKLKELKKLIQNRNPFFALANEVIGS